MKSSSSGNTGVLEAGSETLGGALGGALTAADGVEEQGPEVLGDVRHGLHILIGPPPL